MNSINKMNSTNIFTNSYDYIVNYLVNDKIIIKDNDSTETKIKQYLLKYKRIIGIILLIILIYIGYETGILINNNNNNNNNDNNNNHRNVNHSIQKGGLISTESVSKDIGKATDTIKNALTHAKDKTVRALTTKEGAKGALHKGFKVGHEVGARLGEEFKERSSALYSLMYSVALFIIVCIIFVPTIAFIVGGIMCYVLLKGKMRTIKGL